MSTGVTSKQLNALHKMTDAEFAMVLVTLGGVAFGGTSTAAGFFSRFSLTKAAGYLTSYEGKAALVLIVERIFEYALTNGLDADIVRTKIMMMIFDKTGLQLETLDIEGAKKAAGKLLADKVNEHYGTSFTAFYPPENIVDQIKQQIENEVVEALK